MIIDERVRLVDDLRQFTPAEEELDRRRNALRIDRASGGHVLHFLHAHPLLNGAAELEETLPQFFRGELVDRAEAAVTEVVDVVDVRGLVVDAELDQVPDRVDEVRAAGGHSALVGDVLAELAVDAEPANAAEPVAVDVEELLLEEPPSPSRAAADCRAAAAGRS